MAIARTSRACRAIEEVDAEVGRWLDRLAASDLLVITADHGCDPTTPGSDHTREHVPLLARLRGTAAETRRSVADVGASVLTWLSGRDAALPGKSFL